MKKIVISDPHQPQLYIYAFIKLLGGLQKIFPHAEIVVALHGQNEIIQNYCDLQRVRYKRLFEEPKQALTIYEDCDIHVGFRVHGHVSALKSKIPSYLLEQDGRGADYALTLSRKISVPCYPTRNLRSIGKYSVLESPVTQVLSMIENDYTQGFSRFLGGGLQDEIDSYSIQSENTVQQMLSKLSLVKCG